MLKKTLHKNGVQGFYREPMVVSNQALPKFCLFLPIVKKFKLLLVVNCHLFLHSEFALLSFYTQYVTQVKYINMLITFWFTILTACRAGRQARWGLGLCDTHYYALAILRSAASLCIYITILLNLPSFFFTYQNIHKSFCFIKIYLLLISAVSLSIVFFYSIIVDINTITLHCLHNTKLITILTQIVLRNAENSHLMSFNVICILRPNKYSKII